jgi:hypothetical protein
MLVIGEQPIRVSMREWAQGELAAARVTIAEIKRELWSGLPLPYPIPKRSGHQTSPARCPKW